MERVTESSYIGSVAPCRHSPRTAAGARAYSPAASPSALAVWKYGGTARGAVGPSSRNPSPHRTAWLRRVTTVRAEGRLTRALCALGHWLMEAGHFVVFAPSYHLVQELLAAKRNLDLPLAATPKGWDRLGSPLTNETSFVGTLADGAASRMSRQQMHEGRSSE